MILPEGREQARSRESVNRGARVLAREARSFSYSRAVFSDQQVYFHYYPVCSYFSNVSCFSIYRSSVFVADCWLEISIPLYSPEVMFATFSQPESLFQQLVMALERLSM